MEQRAATPDAIGAYGAIAVAAGRQLSTSDWSHKAAPLLAKLWDLANGADPELANIVAWEMGWLLTRRGNLADAAEWFERVSLLPGYEAHQWTIAKGGILEFCRIMADRSGMREPPQLAMTPRARETRGMESADELAALSIQSLGKFQVWRGNTLLLPCGQRRATATFRYLLTRPHYRASRDELADVLWPDSSPREATHSLHVAISALRRYLDVEVGRTSYITFDSGCYGINTTAYIVDDVQVFASHSAQAERYRHNGELERAAQEYAAAIDCYHGDFSTEDLTMDWAVAERERLLSRYLATHDQLGQIHVARERWEDAAQCFERLLESDRYREDIYDQLMRCYQRLGRRGAALSTYLRCVQVLERDLGLAPIPEMQALYRSIKSGTTGQSDRPRIDPSQHNQARDFSRPIVGAGMLARTPRAVEGVPR